MWWLICQVLTPVVLLKYHSQHTAYNLHCCVTPWKTVIFLCQYPGQQRTWQCPISLQKNLPTLIKQILAEKFGKIKRKQSNGPIHPLMLQYLCNTLWCSIPHTFCNNGWFFTDSISFTSTLTFHQIYFFKTAGQKTHLLSQNWLLLSFPL